MEEYDKLQSYLNWNTEQVISWLKGSNGFIETYLDEFSAKGVNGKWLNSLTVDSLAKLGITKVGHQMLIIDRVKQLQNQFLCFENETFQTVLFRVSRSCMCIINAVNSLAAITDRQDNREPGIEAAYPGILSDIQEAVSYVLNSVLNLMTAVSNAAFWLERSPFSMLPEMNNLRHSLITNALRANRAAQEAISSQPNWMFNNILEHVKSMRDYVDHILHNFSDSILLTPCGMELVRIGKLENKDFGFNFVSTSNNVHVIVSVQNGSPAFLTGKINKGDEVIEVNNQIVIGWRHSCVADLMRRYPKCITLRLRKRPTHATDFFGFPGGGSRHRLIPPQTPAGTSPQTRGSYNFTKNPKRRTPLPGPLLAEPLTTTQETPSESASVSSPVSMSPPESQSVITTPPILSPSSSPSSSCGTSMKLIESKSPPNLDNYLATATRSTLRDDRIDSFSNIRTISSSPSTPLLTVRSKNLTDSSLAIPNTDSLRLHLNSGDDMYSHNGTIPALTNDAKKIDIIFPQHSRSPSCSSTNSPFSRITIVHGQTSSGPPSIHKNDRRLMNSISSGRLKISGSPDSKGSHSPKLQPLDKRHRNMYRGSLDEASARKLGLVVRKPSRKISCKDLGQGDCQGWLWLKKSNTLISKYVKRWCLIKNSIFYYYRNPEDESAEGLILLPGFTITPATEVKSGKYSFYIFDHRVHFTFASESELDRSKWMNKLGLASIGLASYVPTSRIGGFNPGYIVSSPSVTQVTSLSSTTPGLVIISEASNTLSTIPPPVHVTSSSTKPQPAPSTRLPIGSVTVAQNKTGLVDKLSKQTLLDLSCNFGARSGSLPMYTETLGSMRTHLDPVSSTSLNHYTSSKYRLQGHSESHLVDTFGCYSESEGELDDEIDSICDLGNEATEMTKAPIEAPLTSDLRVRPGSASPLCKRHPDLKLPSDSLPKPGSVTNLSRQVNIRSSSNQLRAAQPLPRNFLPTVKTAASSGSGSTGSCDNL